MKIRYIYGRAGNGKTQRIFDEIKYRLEEKSDKKLILLVPEQFTLQTESDLITKMDLPGIMRLEILSFERLAYKVLNEAGGLKKITINELGKVMALRRIFDKYGNELIMYKKASKKSGFLSDFSSLITEFKRNDISPDLLKEKAELIEQDNILKKKLHDILFMYEKFSEYMENKYTDDEDRFNLVIEKIDDVDFLNGAEIWIDGFFGFTSQQYRIIEKIAQKADRLNISLTLDLEQNIRDRDLFTPTIKTYKKLRKIALENNIKESKTVLHETTINKTDELKHLEKELYSYPYNKYNDEVSNITIFSGTNQYTEIENVAAQVVYLVRDKEYRWNDIAVVTASMDNYGPIMKKVFTEYGIPYFIDEKRSIMNNPIIKLILSTIQIISRRFRYEDVFRYIKTGFSGLTKFECDKLENYVLKYGIQGDKWFDDFTYGKDDLNEFNEIRNKFITPFIRLKDNLKGKKQVVDITRSMFKFLKSINIEEKLDKWIEKLKERGKLEYVNENTQIWNIVMEVFEQLVEILGDSKVNMKEYFEMLESGFAEYEVGIIPSTIDQVLVGKLERSKNHDIKALFVVGANDGVLPSGFVDEGIILDDEKHMLKEADIPIVTDSETRAYEERFSIYTALAKPSEYLWISYALADSEGKALRCSIIIDRIKNIYPSIKVESDILLNHDRQLHLISRPVSTFKYLIEYLRKYIDGNDFDNMWWDVYNWYYTDKEWHERLIFIVEGLFHSNQENYIGEKRAKEIYDIPLMSSISRLEKFTNCPFSHFVNYGLRPEERKEYKLKAPDIGRLFHTSVEKFFKKIEEKKEFNWDTLNKQDSNKIVKEVIEEIIPEFENGILSSTYRYKYLVNKLIRVSKRALWTLTEHIKKGDFTPYKYEFGFGDKKGRGTKEAPPMIISLPNGEEIRLEGRIDRIDLFEDGEEKYVKIIDYKSGNKKFSLSDVYYGLQIQLIVYLDAIMENKKIDNIHPAGVFYFKIDDPMINSNDVEIKNDEEAKFIEKEIMKKLKMDGLLLKDVKVVKAMDKDIEEEKNSPIIPASMNKNGELSKRSLALEEEEIQALIKHIKNLIAEIAVEILKGNIKIEPCKIDDKISCEYCKYSAICQFDTSFKDNSYKNLKKLSNDVVIERIKSENRGETDA